MVRAMVSDGGAAGLSTQPDLLMAIGLCCAAVDLPDVCYQLHGYAGVQMYLTTGMCK